MKPLFDLLDWLRPDGESRYWIDYSGSQEHPCGAGEHAGQAGTRVTTLPQVSQRLDKHQGVGKIMGKRLKNEIAQQELNDLCRDPVAH
jgi:hypothetical protein